MLDLDEAGRVIHASSFSKTVSPGVRVGYLVGPAEEIATLSKRASENYISPEHAGRVDRLRALPLGRARGEHQGRQRGAAASGATPWSTRSRSRSPRRSSSSPAAATSSGSTSTEGVDTTALLDEAKEEGVTFVAGPDFMLDGGELEPAALVRARSGGRGPRGRWRASPPPSRRPAGGAAAATAA